MAINFSLRDFYDGATEIVGIKSGILLNRFQTSEILIKFFDDKYLKTDNLDTHVRIHASDFEDRLLCLRQKIGNLPEELPSKKAYQCIRKYSLKNKEALMTLASIPSLSFHYLRENPDLTIDELAQLFHENHSIAKEICNACSVIGHERFDQSCSIPPSHNWDETTELSKLYDCELNCENNFLEQKFIDYLAVNGDEIELIHWRNFERFCAEYFKKQGYEVVLGPGTNDGGVDIRAYKKDKSAAPDLLIQCKRYISKNKISIETVKSFYTDVQFENAKNGLIATTSYIAKGGKKVCKTRGYNIKFAEKENMKNWAQEMWTYKK